jgi:hypothetical protein
MKKSKGFQQAKQTTTVQELIGAGRGADNEIENLSVEAPRAMVSQELLEQFERFYEYHPAARLSRNLRSLLLEFLMYDGSTEAEYLRDLVIDLDGLFTLLDAMQEEAESPPALA